MPPASATKRRWDPAAVKQQEAPSHGLPGHFYWSEEQFAADNHGQYFSGTATPEAPLNGFTPSPSVTVTMTAFNIMGSQLADWTAIARHPQSAETCAMRAGMITCTTGNALTTGILN